MGRPPGGIRCTVVAVAVEVVVATVPRMTLASGRVGRPGAANTALVVAADVAEEAALVAEEAAVVALAARGQLEWASRVRSGPVGGTVALFAEDLDKVMVLLPAEHSASQEDFGLVAGSRRMHLGR